MPAGAMRLGDAEGRLPFARGLPEAMSIGTPTKNQAVAVKPRPVRRMQVANPVGLHLRAAAQIVKLARAFNANVTIPAAAKIP